MRKFIVYILTCCVLPGNGMAALIANRDSPVEATIARIDQYFSNQALASPDLLSRSAQNILGEVDAMRCRAFQEIASRVVETTIPPATPERKAEIFRDLLFRWDRLPWDPTILGHDPIAKRWRDAQYHIERGRTVEIAEYETAMRQLWEIGTQVQEGRLLSDAQIVLIKSIATEMRLADHLLAKKRPENSVDFPVVTREELHEAGWKSLEAMMVGLSQGLFACARIRIYGHLHLFYGPGKFDEMEPLANIQNKITREFGGVKKAWVLDNLNFSRLESEVTQLLRQVDRAGIREKRYDIDRIGTSLKIEGHGVGAMKGGLLNLLNIILECQLRPSKGTVHFGELTDGEMDRAAGPHGPYYVALNSPVHEGSVFRESFALYLVPTDSAKGFLVKALLEASELGFMDPALLTAEVAKIITYDEFIGLPREILKARLGPRAA